MKELEYAKEIINDRCTSTRKVTAISKALIAVTAQLEELTKQLFPEREANMALVAENAALRRIALGYHILTVPEREAPTEPEIDAVIAELRAQGADTVAEYHKVRVDALIDVDRKGANEHKVSYMAARDVAANLRAGRKG